jgi:short-subunit dehydrogenase
MNEIVHNVNKKEVCMNAQTTTPSNSVGKTALITGASGGLGLEFAHLFAQAGYNLILVARSATLQQIADDIAAKDKVQTRAILADLSSPEAPQSILDAVTGAGQTVDVLVNNAGFATFGLFTDLDLHKELNLIQLNISALVHLTGLFLPAMRARKSGYILNVASTAAFMSGPLMATYYASKAFVLSWSQALATENKDKGIRVTALCPGPTETGFQKRAAMTDSKLVQSGLMDARSVARAGYAGLMAGKSIVVPGRPNQITVFLTRFLPRAMAAQMAMNAQARISH